MTSWIECNGCIVLKNDGDYETFSSDNADGLWIRLENDTIEVAIFENQFYTIETFYNIRNVKITFNEAG